ITALALAGAANAADLPPAYKAPPPPPVVAPAYNWSGFYIGGHFGGGWARKAWEERSNFEKGFGSICFSGLEPELLELDGPGGLCVFEELSYAPGSPFGQNGFVGSHNAIGPLGGFQAGFNWQPVGSHWVFGIEGEFSFADLKGDHQNSTSGTAAFGLGDRIGVDEIILFPTTQNGTINDRFSTRVRDIATIAGRIGITSDLFDRTLFYIKG